MVQPTQLASSSVPDLRARQPLFKLMIVIGLLAIGAAIVGAVLFIKNGDNPGRAACDHVEELASKQETNLDKWVDALVRTVETRAWNSVDHKYVVIGKGTRYERCTESFDVIRDTISYSKYMTLSECVSKMTTWRQGAACFDTF